MSDVAAVRHGKHPQAPLDVFRNQFCKCCQKRDSCHDDRNLERNCIHAALLDEIVFARRLRTQR